jgi:hypothetical protein
MLGFFPVEKEIRIGVLGILPDGTLLLGSELLSPFLKCNVVLVIPECGSEIITTTATIKLLHQAQFRKYLHHLAHTLHLFVLLHRGRTKLFREAKRSESNGVALSVKPAHSGKSTMVSVCTRLMLC